MASEEAGVAMLNWIWAGLVIIALVVGAINGRLDAVTKAAFDGAKTAVCIIPFLVAILVGISMLRASGALDLAVRALSPLTEAVGLPAEVLPVALLRPLSGSGTLGLVSELSKAHGPDSFIGLLAATMYGSTETTFYVLAVYFGAVGITPGPGTQSPPG